MRTVHKGVNLGCLLKVPFLGPSTAIGITATGGEVQESEFLTSISNDSDAR